jgi:hypothetical protein
MANNSEEGQVSQRAVVPVVMMMMMMSVANAFNFTDRNLLIHHLTLSNSYTPAAIPLPRAINHYGVTNYPHVARNTFFVCLLLLAIRIKYIL